MDQLTSEQVRVEVSEAWRICSESGITVDRMQKVIDGLVIVLARTAGEADVTMVEAAILNANHRMALMATKPLYDLGETLNDLKAELEIPDA